MIALGNPQEVAVDIFSRIKWNFKTDGTPHCCPHCGGEVFFQKITFTSRDVYNQAPVINRQHLPVNNANEMSVFCDSCKRSGVPIDRIALGGATVGIIGLVVLTAPSTGAQLNVRDGALMILAGVAWAIYSICGAKEHLPLLSTARNFRRAVPIAFVFNAWCASAISIDIMGAIFAVTSGAITSALGYAIWYAVLPFLGVVRAATVQLSVPAITAVAGIILFQERFTPLQLIAEVLILSGIALTVRRHS